MKVERREVDGVVVVSAAESFDVSIANADAFRGAVADAMGEARLVVLDASRIEFFDSVGMSTLLSLRKKVGGAGGRFAIAGLNPSIRDVFRMVGFDVVFETYDEADQAAAALRG